MCIFQSFAQVNDMKGERSGMVYEQCYITCIKYFTFNMVDLTFFSLV